MADSRSAATAVTDIRFTPAWQQARSAGLLGFVRFTFAGLIFDGVAVRRRRDGRHYLAFPQREDRHGQRHSLVRPTNDAIRRELEHQVLAALGLHPEARS